MRLATLLTVFALGLGTIDVAAEGNPMTESEEYAQIDAGKNSVSVSHTGGTHHRRIQIGLVFGQNSVLTFAASGLKEHPDMLLPRFAGNIEWFEHFSVQSSASGVHVLSAHMRTAQSATTPRVFTIGPVKNEDLRLLTEVLAPHGIEVRKE